MVRRAVAVSLFVVLLGSVVPATAGVLVEPEALKTGRSDQFGPAAEGDDWLGWSQWVRPLYTARAQPLDESTPPQALRKRPDAHTFFGDFDPSTDRAIFQDVSGSSSNLYYADLSVEGAPTSAPPAGINTRSWEWSPEMSSAFILFGRNRFARGSSPWKVILYDRTLQTFTVLDEVTNRCGCIYPEDVNERYAAWTKCVRRCNVWVYDTQDLGADPVKVPNPDKQQYGAALSEEGRVYFVRSGNTCGGNARILAWDVEVGGTTTLVYDYPVGTNLAWSLDVVDGVDGAHDVYFDRAECNDPDYRGDIYRIVDAYLGAGPIFRGPSAAGLSAGGDAAATRGAWRGPQRPGARPIG